MVPRYNVGHVNKCESVMNHFSALSLRLFFLIITLSFAPSSFAEPKPNLTHFKQTLTSYHDSGQYEKEVTAVIARARHYINQRAQANQQAAHPQKLAIVLDIDETSLSNFPRIKARDYAETKGEMLQEYQAADASALRPTLALYQDAIQHGIHVFFITGRPRTLLPATVVNLKKAGYPQWVAIYMRPKHYQGPSIVPFKSQTRAGIAKQGYTIIASVGDQNSDLLGGYAEKTFKLPNPFYAIP